MMMKKLLIAAALIAAMPGAAFSQVDKRVEVTKAYVPSIENAAKLPAVPDMTDTARMRPDIDYTVTPLTLRTTLATRPIRPATVTYWEFNRPQPFYLKIGAGYPANSVVDFYGSTQNPGTGYLLGYVNHEGRYADLVNDFDVKNNSTRIFNRVGVAAGKYFGRHTLEGDISYDNRLYHRYGAYLSDNTFSTYVPGARVNFGDLNAAVRFGDDFQDLTRTNFEVAVRGGMYMTYPELADVPGTPGIEDRNGRQTTIETHAKIARAFGRHRFSLEAGYERLAGQLALGGNRQQQVHAALRYGVEGRTLNFEAGADYYYDRVDGQILDMSDLEVRPHTKTGNYIIPFLRLDMKLGTAALKPFVELDGGVYDNSHRSLTRLNPYIASTAWGEKSSVDYNGRFGLGGSLWRDRFTYRVYAGFSIRDNHPYWYGMLQKDSYACNPTLVTFARQTVTSINGEVEWRPVSPLLVSLGAHGYFYNNETSFYNGSPSFEGNLGLRYEGRRIAFGVSAAVQSTRRWTLVVNDFNLISAPISENTVYEVPFAVDMRVDFDWKISRRTTVFAEGRNLLNRRLYEHPWYPEYGANFTAGVKLNF